MTSKPSNPNQEPGLDHEKEYRALVRSIRWTKGFGLLFVQCSPAEGNRLIERVREDLPEKRIEVLSLRESIYSLYDVVDALPNKDQIDVLFIQGLEYSLYEYEKTQLWDEPSDQYTYSEKGIPQILGNLNLGRERLAENFKLCFVFLVPLFVLKYLARRSPDFFDWRSGVLEFVSDIDLVEKETFRLIREANNQKYLSWTQSERNQKILDIQSWSEEPNQSSERKAELLIEQGNLLAASQEYESAIISYDQALQFKPASSEIFRNRSDILLKLERYEEALTGYDHALKLHPTDYEALVSRTIILLHLNRFEEVESTYEQISKLETYDSDNLYVQGLLLKLWGIKQWNRLRVENIQQLTHAVQLISGNMNQESLIKGKLEYAKKDLRESVAQAEEKHQQAQKKTILKLTEAIQCFNRCLVLQPNNGDAYYEKAACYAFQNQIKDAILNLETAFTLSPNYRQVAATDSAFDSIRKDDRFQALINEAES